MCIEQFEYDLIILDLMLPGISGEELLNEIRKKHVMPIIVASAKTSAEESARLIGNAKEHASEVLQERSEDSNKQ